MNDGPPVFPSQDDGGLHNALTQVDTGNNLETIELSKGRII